MIHGEIKRMRPSQIMAGLFGFGLSFCLPTAASAADPKVYVEVGAALTDAGFTDGDAHISGLARAGIEVSSWAAIEAEGILGLDDTSDRRSNGDRREKGLNHQFGGFLRLGVPINDKILPYARLGYATAQTSVEIQSTEAGMTEIIKSEDNFGGPAFGFGIRANFGEDAENGIRLDLTGLISDGDEDEFFDLLDGTAHISLTYVRRF